MRLVNDKMFKAVFGSESSKEILVALLNAILDYPEESKITELTLLNPFSQDNYALDKTVIMDVKAKDKQGRSYNIEVQVVPPIAYVNRVVYYLAKLLGGQLQTGEDYKQLAKTISISIIGDKEVFHDMDDFHNIFRYKHIENNRELGDMTEIHFIELTKFVKTRSEELKTKLDKWVSFLKFGDKYRESGYYPEELKKEKEISMAIEQFGKISADEKFMYYLMDIEKANRDQISAIVYARDEGKLEGIFEGERKGKLEAKLAIAAQMMAKKLPASLIMEVTGLSQEDINKIN